MLIAVALAVIIIDQGSKFLVRSQMAEMQTIPLIDNIFHLTYVRNPGAAFSLLPNQTPVFIAITLLAAAVAIFFYYRVEREKIWLRLGIALMLGGAVGNLIDRIRFGEVVDFLDFRIWPVFNLADSAIVVGVALICWQLIRQDLRSRGDK
ncbi:signal peptidase II [Candidatus Formimonas warabiya]|uniref:Lipoprotein signal peptidase n=1 Tax=Formimonas warabiya TaxID=1761012 RepID=A0A3G1KQZ9_FORW1|nr:signal peptidase II [Candidatus Formimonas warabiya]ATW24870.1 signal peptidase II [Candidatus Formimonas warabiya]